MKAIERTERHLARLEARYHKAHAESMDALRGIRTQREILRRQRIRLAHGKGRRPQSLQEPARSLYRAAFNAPLPPGTKVVASALASVRGWHGSCTRGRPATIVLYNTAHRDRNEVSTLVHEFIHLRNPRLKHGAEFERLVAAAVARVWTAAE